MPQIQVVIALIERVKCRDCCVLGDTGWLIEDPQTLRSQVTSATA